MFSSSYLSDSSILFDVSQGIAASMGDLASQYLPALSNHQGIPALIPPEQLLNIEPILDPIEALVEASIDVLTPSLLSGKVSCFATEGDCITSLSSAQNDQASLPVDKLLGNESNVIPRRDTADFLLGDLANVFSPTVAKFDLKADLSKEKNFYNLPYPFDWRLDELGRPDLTGYPIWDLNPVIVGLKESAADQFGFSTLSTGYFSL